MRGTTASSPRSRSIRSRRSPSRCGTPPTSRSTRRRRPRPSAASTSTTSTPSAARCSCAARGRATSSRSRSWSSGRAAGAGRRSSPASASWPTSSRSRGCASPASTPRAGVVRFGDGITLPWAPFPGTIGVAPDEPGPHSIVPPSRFGGNMDIRHLRAGTKLLLPVGVEGALLSVGDTHAAQGDGEVCGTAVETAMEIVLRPSIRRDLRIDAPQYVLPARPPDRGPRRAGPRVHRRRPRPVGGRARRRAGGHLVPAGPSRTRPGGGVRRVQRGL